MRVGLGLNDGRLAVTISDNGRGFAFDQARSKGEGLENMRQRLVQIGGQFVLESLPGHGTTVRLEAGAA